MGTATMKIGCWEHADTEQRRHRERPGLDTPLVYAVNDVYYSLQVYSYTCSGTANALSIPPGDNGRKATIQRTCLFVNQFVEHVP